MSKWCKVCWSRLVKTWHFDEWSKYYTEWLSQLLSLVFSFEFWDIVHRWACLLNRMVVAFSLRARSLGECLTFYSLRVLFLKVEIRLLPLISLIRPRSVHRGSASWDDWPSVSWWIACELISWYVPWLCLDSSRVSPLQLWIHITYMHFTSVEFCCFYGLII